MKAVLQQHKKGIQKVETNQEKHTEEARINEMLTRYFVWYMKNNIEEYNMFYKFWNQKFTNQSSAFLR